MPCANAHLVEHSQQSIREAQLSDEGVGPILRARESGKQLMEEQLQKHGIVTQRLAQLWEQMDVKEGVLYYQPHWYVGMTRI